MQIKQKYTALDWITEINDTFKSMRYLMKLLKVINDLIINELMKRPRNLPYEICVT